MPVNDVKSALIVSCHLEMTRLRIGRNRAALKVLFNPSARVQVLLLKRMSASSPRTLRIGKTIYNSSLVQNSPKVHSNMYSNPANVDFDSHSSETHRDENNSISQEEMKNQIIKLQTEINKIKTLQATLTQ